MVNNGTAYLFWLAFFFGLGGIQRFYLGKPISGILYLCTWGFFGVGQLLDIALIPGMVDEKKHKMPGTIQLSTSNSSPSSCSECG
ncbi:MAG: TM2 domain-containing protein [Cyanobacteria bacterium P01_A01_bin.17]